MKLLSKLGRKALYYARGISGYKKRKRKSLNLLFLQFRQQAEAQRKDIAKMSGSERIRHWGKFQALKNKLKEMAAAFVEYCEENRPEEDVKRINEMLKEMRKEDPLQKAKDVKEILRILAFALWITEPGAESVEFEEVRHEEDVKEMMNDSQIRSLFDKTEAERIILSVIDVSLRDMELGAAVEEFFGKLHEEYGEEMTQELQKRDLLARAEAEKITVAHNVVTSKHAREQAPATAALL